MKIRNIDCLVIGFNDMDFPDYVKMVRSMGEESGAFRDLNYYFVEYDGRPHRSMDLLNRFHFQDRRGKYSPFHNADFIWPVVMYLCTYLARRDLTFDYVNLFHFEKDELREKLLGNDIATVAITTTLYVSPQPILEILSFVRKHNRTAKIIIGGPYIMNQVGMSDDSTIQNIFKYIDADFYVISPEGEHALVGIIEAVKSGSGFDAIENIAYREGAGYKITPVSAEANPLEENMIDYGLFPKEEIGEFVSLRTSKSCPFACAFCGFPERGGKYTYLGVDLIERQLDAIRDIGSVTTLTFIDDTFNVPKERFKGILRMMIRNGYDFKWNCQYRCDHGDAEVIELMRKAGCEGVFLGIESGSDELLRSMNKTARRKDYLRAVPMLRDAGISTHANLIVGFPPETYGSVRETIRLIEETKPDFVRAQLWYCDPVTPIWKRKDEYGLEGSAFEWAHNTMDSRGACDLIDEMFLSIGDSVWLPQNGFEQWSTFYLQRKGMAPERIRAFLKCFNAIVKDKLVYSDRRDIDPALLDGLVKSSRFDDHIQPDMRPVDIRSGAGFTASERFWVEELGGGSPPPVTGALGGNPGKRDYSGESRISMEFEIEKSVHEDLKRRYKPAPPVVYAAAFSVLISRLSAVEDTAMVSDIDDMGTFPLRLYPSWNSSFGEFVREADLRIVSAARHRRYGFYILSRSPLIPAESRPPFDVGYLYCGKSGKGMEGGMREIFELYPSLDRGVNLILGIFHRDGGPGARFSYRRDCFEPETINMLAGLYISLLEDIARNRDVLIGEIGLDGERDRRGSAESIDTDEDFNF